MFAHEKTSKAGGNRLEERLTGVTAIALIAISTLLGACGTGPQDVSTPGPALIQDLTPIGTPDWAELGTGYSSPEMFPVFVIDHPYEAPEMWPETERQSPNEARIAAGPR